MDLPVVEDIGVVAEENGDLTGNTLLVDTAEGDVSDIAECGVGRTVQGASGRRPDCGRIVGDGRNLCEKDFTQCVSDAVGGRKESVGPRYRGVEGVQNISDGLLFMGWWNRKFEKVKKVEIETYAVGRSVAHRLTYAPKTRVIGEVVQISWIHRTANLVHREVVADDGAVQLGRDEAAGAVAGVDLGDDELTGGDQILIRRSDAPRAVRYQRTWYDSSVANPNRHLGQVGVRGDDDRRSAPCGEGLPRLHLPMGRDTAPRCEPSRGRRDGRHRESGWGARRVTEIIAVSWAACSSSGSKPCSTVFRSLWARAWARLRRGRGKVPLSERAR